MNYEEKYKEIVWQLKKAYLYAQTDSTKAVLEEILPELAESEDEKIRKWCISHFKECINVIKDNDEYKEYLINKVLAWLERQGEQKPNPYSGTSFEYNGHIWGMCARDNGVDISCDKYLIKHLEKQCEQMHANWSGDEKVRKVLIDFFGKGAKYGGQTNGVYDKDILAWLEKQKGNIGGISPNWSEEDEQHVNSLLKRLQGMCKKGATYTATRFAVSQDIDWLKSLKERKGGKI